MNRSLNINFFYKRLWNICVIFLFIVNLCLIFYEHSLTQYIFIVFNIISLFFVRFAFININSISIKLYLTTFLLGYNFFLPVLYIFKDKFTHPGWRSVGNFDFISTSYLFPLFVALFFLFIFVLTASYFDKVFKIPIYKINSFDNNLSRIKNQEYSGIEKLIIIIFPFFVFLNLFIFYFMFTYQIGVTGITPIYLPYKITGILYYYRLLLLPLIYIWFVSFIKDKIPSRFLIFLLFISANFAALISGSKGLYILHMLPVLIYLVKWRYYKLLIVSSLFLFISLPAYSLIRNIIYPLTYEFSGTPDFSTLLYLPEYIFNIISIKPMSIIENAFLYIGRALGIRELLMTIYNPIQINNINIIFNNFFGLKFLDNNNFSPFSLTGVVLREGRGFSAGVDLISYIYLSSSNILSFILITISTSFAFVSLEKILIFILKNLKLNENIAIVIIHLLFFRYSQRLDFLPMLLGLGVFLVLIKLILLNSKAFKIYK